MNIIMVITYLLMSANISGPEGNKEWQQLTILAPVLKNTTIPIFPNNKNINYAVLEGMINKWLFFYTNLFRKQSGSDTLAISSCLIQAASSHAIYLCNVSIEKKQFVLLHEEDSGSVWFKGYGPIGRSMHAGCELSCGENALYIGLPIFEESDFKDLKQLDHTAQKIAKSMVYDNWQYSKGHRDNMLDKRYKFMGTSVSVINANFNDCNNGAKGTFIYLVAFAIQVFGIG